jgi:hypothetical protein
MSGATEQTSRDTADREPPTPERRDSSVGTEVPDSDPLAGTQLRTLAPESLQILAATGC